MEKCVTQSWFKQGESHIYISESNFKVEVELSVRADKFLTDGTEIPIQFVVRFVESDGVSNQKDFSKDISLTVKDLTESNDPSKLYAYDYEHQDK